MSACDGFKWTNCAASFLMQQMDVILGIVSTSANHWHIHAFVLRVPACSKCALARISACTGDFEMHSRQLGNEKTSTSIILYNSSGGFVDNSATLILRISLQIHLNMSYLWTKVIYINPNFQKRQNILFKRTWSTNPLIIERCFEGYDAKMFAVALAPVTASSPSV